MPTCLHLQQWAKDPDFPIAYDRDNDTYSLQLSPTVSVENTFCPHCGGRGQPSPNCDEPPCRCGKLKEWAANPTIPVEYNEEMNEYNLMLPPNWAVLFYFCPSCGGRTPRSRSHECFTEPSAEEIEAIRRRLTGVTTIQQVIETLGEPGQRFGAMVCSAKDKAIYGMKDIRQTLRYTSLSDSVVLNVQENDAGEISFIFAGQWIGRPRRRKWWQFWR